jgi:hypothetical protein
MNRLMTTLVMTVMKKRAIGFNSERLVQHEKSLRTIGNEVSGHMGPLLPSTATMEHSRAPECPKTAKKVIRPNAVRKGLGHVPQGYTLAYIGPKPTS